ncbi:MAG TPA: 30S ribosomal protein S9 [Thermodesulfobacteriota bacterium]|jgi:small subunit ribosomal protein S9
MAEAVYQGTGRRKTSVARVLLRTGEGKISINEKPVESYFPRETWRAHALEALQVTQTSEKYDVVVDVNGGGLKGQAGAVRLGLARALLRVSEAFKKSLKSAGLLTRDSRMVESKKYGRRKARRGQQYSKR